jgi:hypothetical protein
MEEGRRKLGFVEFVEFVGFGEINSNSQVVSNRQC